MKYKNWQQSGRLRLDEHPVLVKDTDFGLGDDEYNRKEAERFLSKEPTEVYKETNDVLFARFGDDKLGEIVYIDFKKDDPTINYYVEFQKVKVKNVNPSVYQSSVWRNDRSVGGIVKKVFFDILFEMYDCICSDEYQTNHGARLWKTQMAEAIDKGLYVGLWDSFDQEIDWFDSTKEGYNVWSKRTFAFAWGSNSEKSTYRFFISKNKI